MIRFHALASGTLFLFWVWVAPFAQTARPEVGARQTNSLGMELVYCPAGEFAMGSPPEEKMRQEEERVHKVRITRGFYLGRTEVTQAQWSSLMEVNRSRDKGDRLPVQNVSWKEASEFCRRLSQREGKSYRLPTEAEWEYACRAGAQGAWEPADPVQDQAWFADNSDETTHPAGTRKPNAWGLLDMLGNVAEWCSDWYAPYEASPASDPGGPAEGTARVVRGGSWRHFRPMLRPAARSSCPESYQYPHLGFRVRVDAAP